MTALRRKLSRGLGRLALTAVLTAACGSPPVAPGQPAVSPSAALAAPSASPTTAPATAAPVTAAPASATPSPSPSPTPAAVCGADCWPLTGRPLAGGDPARRPLVVKIDNAPLARPHHGITKADLVFETLVEGFVTRLAAIFHSEDPGVIASIRSARLTDRSLVPLVRGALVYSGTSDYEVPLLAADERAGKLIDIGATRLNLYYRLPGIPAPNNLAARTSELRAALAAIDARPADVPRWAFLAGAHAPEAGGLTGAKPASELTIPYRTDRVLVTYRYDAASRTYGRWQNEDKDGPVRTVDGNDNRPVAAANVVVLYTDVREVPEIVDSAGFVSYDSRLTGSGRATIFRDGLRLEGRWERANDAAPFSFSGPDGARVLLAAGQTWIQVIPTSWVVASR